MKQGPGRSTIWSTATSAENRIQGDNDQDVVEQQKRPQKVDERPLASGWRTYASICWIRSTDWGRKHYVLPWFLRCSHSSHLGSMTETTTMPGRPISWIHNDAPLVPGRIHTHSLYLGTIQLRPFPFGYLETTSCSWGSSRTATASLKFSVWNSLNGESGLWALITVYGNVRFMWVISSGPTKLKSKVSLAFSFLYPIHRYKKRCARCEYHVKWSSGAIYSTRMFDSNPKLSCVVQNLKKWAFWGTV